LEPPQSVYPKWFRYGTIYLAEGWTEAGSTVAPDGAESPGTRPHANMVTTS